MKPWNVLFAANESVQTDQGCIWGNGLPFAHNRLRVKNFTRQHGPRMHGKLQHVHHFFAAVHFHVGACRNEVSAALRFLGSSVIEQAPKRANRAVSLHAGIVHINDTRIGDGHFLPFSVRCVRSHQAQKCCCQESARFEGAQKPAAKVDGVFQRVVCNFHAPYYKVDAHN